MPSHEFIEKIFFDENIWAMLAQKTPLMYLFSDLTLYLRAIVGVSLVVSGVGMQREEQKEKKTQKQKERKTEGRNRK